MTVSMVEALNSEDGESSVYDIAVIGGGVVGCAVARRFTLEGARVILIERAPDILAGASKGNSGILHTGFDASPGSLESSCIRQGYCEYMEVRGRLGLPVLKTGAILAAWTGPEVQQLNAIEDRALENGITDVRQLSTREVLEREPYLAKSILAGLLIPGEFVIDPWSAPLAYLRQAIDNGAVARFKTEVKSGSLTGSGWHLQTMNESIHARTVINCAGLFGDLVDSRILGRSEFTIRPRKGQFVVFDKVAAKLIGSIILPVPAQRSKGILLTRTIFGNVLVGPTAEEQEDRERAPVDQRTLKILIDKAAAIVPALRDIPVTAVYAGLRPATEHNDYCVKFDQDRNWITVGGIRSTGLSAALGIAQYVFKLYSSDRGEYRPIERPVWPTVPNLAEHCIRDFERPGYGEIVCHCEMTTRREIEAALEGPLPARDLGGLKRRTRAAMGRCQGFYCSARLAELTRGRLSEPLAVDGPRE